MDLTGPPVKAQRQRPDLIDAAANVTIIGYKDEALVHVASKPSIDIDSIRQTTNINWLALVGYQATIPIIHLSEVVQRRSRPGSTVLNSEL
ncbi:hypothetical protein FHL15_006640 [Xylaria flabelliformis]|uniref:Uncharacterized protein n=1 Tax=Xylaria flabelliformis TaxID=2512241 RepID=A0A553HWZ2_9PEZI|nr:hypothetical protein FHL15_006640 [Xylaria flabelliformis]